MSTPSPETVAAEPKITPEQLRDADPAKRAEILEPYQKDLNTMASWQVDQMVTQGIYDGVFQRNEDANEDNIFNGQEVALTAPDVKEAQDLLKALQDRKVDALTQETTTKLLNEVQGKPDDKKAEHLAFMLERSLRDREVGLQAAKPGRPEVQAKAAVQAQGNQRAKPAVAYQAKVDPVEASIHAANRKEMIVKTAFETVRGGLTGPGQKEEFDRLVAQMAANKEEIFKDEDSRKSRAESHTKREAQNRAEKARRDIDLATRAKENTKAQNEQIMEHGLHQEVLPKGTKIDNPMRGHYEKNADGTYKVDSVTGARIWVASKVDSNDRLRADAKVTSQSIVDEALKMDEQRDLELQLGKEGAAKELARRQRQEELDKQIDGARNALARDLASGQLIRVPGQPSRAPELSDYGPNGTLRTADPEKAEQAAYAADREATAVLETADHYQQQINNEPDMNIRKQLEAARDAAIKGEKTKQEGLSTEIAQRRADAIAVAEDVRVKAAAKQKSSTTVRAGDPHAEEVASERRRAGNFNAVPFLEVKKGGFFARKKNRGPKVMESYYHVDDGTGTNTNTVMLERRNRRTGELVSQSIFTTEKPMRERRTLRGKTKLPPREMHKQVDEIRATDKAKLQELSGSQWGSKSVLDFVRPGFGSKGLYGPDGAYSKHIAAQPTDVLRTKAAADLNTFKASGRKRRGGFVYWLSDGNV